jgi:hypothetical protein
MRPMATALICLPLCVDAQQALSDNVSPLIGHIESGITCAPRIDGTADAADTVAGSVNVIRSPLDFVSAGPVVPAALGIGLGVKAQLADPFVTMGVTIVVTHPPMGSDGITRQSWQTSINGFEPLLNSYRFEQDAELLTGAWTITAMAGGTMLYHVSFDVVAPETVPQLTALCTDDGATS